MMVTSTEQHLERARPFRDLRVLSGAVDLDALLDAAPRHPRRIVCLTEETTETLYRLGAGDLVVGISCFTLRPPEARNKPKVSSFLDAKLDEIVALQPD